MPARAIPDALAVSELSQATEQARVYLALGHHDHAVEVLQEHIGKLPRSMPAAWLMLLEVFHATGRRQDFRKLAEEFHLQFNAQAPLWEEFSSREAGSGLDAFPHVVARVVESWPTPECRSYLERLLRDNREGRRNGFPLATYSDILLLVQILDAPEPVDIDLDLADAGKLDLEPRGAAAPASAGESRPPAEPGRSRKPMPPDPSAARPAQQPIRFELDLDPGNAARDAGKKPGA